MGEEAEIQYRHYPMSEKKPGIDKIDYRRKKNTRRTFRKAVIRTPSRNAAQIPILILLSRSPGSEMKTKEVLQDLRNGPWFDRLNSLDKAGIYELSRKNVFDSVVKFSRKALVFKKELFPVEVSGIGIWKATVAGVERSSHEGPTWKATYSLREALIEEFTPDSTLSV
jgi:hypothetical protein